MLQGKEHSAPGQLEGWELRWPAPGGAHASPDGSAPSGNVGSDARELGDSKARQ